MYLRQLFRILFRTLNHQYDYTFDWTMLKQKAAGGGGAGGSQAAATPGKSKYTAGLRFRSPWDEPLTRFFPSTPASHSNFCMFLGFMFVKLV